MEAARGEPVWVAELGVGHGVLTAQLLRHANCQGVAPRPRF